MQVESMFTATKHQHFRKISILRAETTTVYLNSEEGESYVCVTWLATGLISSDTQRLSCKLTNIWRRRRQLARADVHGNLHGSRVSAHFGSTVEKKEITKKKKEKPLQTSARTKQSALGKPSIA